VYSVPPVAENVATAPPPADPLKNPLATPVKNGAISIKV
jgi:hypothetical protein